MAKVKEGDTVKVHYTGKIKDGEVFDSSVEREPFQISLGNGTIIPGFEKAVMGLEVGETDTVDITPDEAYGDRHEGMITEQPILDEEGNRMVPEGVEPGLSLQGTGPNGEPVSAVILEVSDTTVKLDYNHLLAGKDLTFEITLVENLTKMEDSKDESSDSDKSDK